jgi:hypothetical protein
MRQVQSSNLTALEQNALVIRDFIWFKVKNISTGNPHTEGYWSGSGTVEAAVIDPETGNSQNRTFVGAGSLIQISEIPLVSNLVVRDVTIELSQVNPNINNLIRGFQVKQGEVQIFRGLFNPDTQEFVAPAEPRFWGFINEVTINTPAEGDFGSVEVNCVSHAQETIRLNTNKRSQGDQVRRQAGDNFFQDVSVVADWTVFWGNIKGQVETTPPPILTQGRVLT